MNKMNTNDIQHLVRNLVRQIDLALVSSGGRWVPALGLDSQHSYLFLG